jgi:AraC family transcriptional regulator
MDVEIRTMPEMRTAAVHHVGPYPEIGKAFGRAAAWAREKGIPFEANFIGIYYDDPSRTPPAELRSDACVRVPESMNLTGEPLSEVRIHGGTYAVATHVGSYEKLGESWMKFYSEGLAKLGKSPIGPGIEIYIDDCDKTPVDQVRTEIAVPVT